VGSRRLRRGCVIRAFKDDHEDVRGDKRADEREDERKDERENEREGMSKQTRVDERGALNRSKGDPLP
jgi:hypothetical protein